MSPLPGILESMKEESYGFISRNSPLKGVTHTEI